MNAVTRAVSASVVCAAWIAAGCQAPYLLSQSGSQTWSEPDSFAVSGPTIRVDYQVSGRGSFSVIVYRAAAGVGSVPGTEIYGPDLTLSGEARTGSWQATVEPGTYTIVVEDDGCTWSITVH